MNRSKSAALNVFSTIGYKIITAICGFIVPRLILETFGSNINGTITTISNFMGVITLMECGFDSVVKSAFFKPLAQKNKEEISSIYNAANSFFSKVAWIFLGYCVILAIVFPYLNDNGLGFAFNAGLVLILGISSFIQEYIGITYTVLTNADQKSYISSFLQIGCIFINTLIVVILIKLGASIHIVKIASAGVFMLRPIILHLYGKRHYLINRKITFTRETIPHKWDNMGQSVASFINSKADYVIMTIFVSMVEASVYAVYCLVTESLKFFLSALSTGFVPGLGNIYAKNETSLFKKTFSMYEFVNTLTVFFLYSVAAALIIPFVRVYTIGVDDVNYIRPLFGIILLLASSVEVFRLPYYHIAVNAGHFREIRRCAYIEASINFVLSVSLVFPLGILGLAIGTLVASLYRTIWFVFYSSKHIIERRVFFVVKRIIVNLVGGLGIISISYIINIEIVNLWTWILKATIVSIIGIFILGIINFVVYKDDFKNVMSHIIRLLKRNSIK